MNFAIDAGHRLTSKTDSRLNKTLNWTYDKAGNLKTKTDYQRDVTTYQYDASNRLVAETNPAYVQVSYHYDGAGRLLDRILSNGAKTQYRYDAGGRLSQLTNTTVTGQIVNDTTYTRDRVGNILTTTDTQGAASYQYDPVYRLLTANGGAAINVAAKAQGATATASSSLTGTTVGDFLPNGAIDGDRIHWTDPGSVAGTPAHAWADGTDSVFPDSWQVTFSGPKTIDTINVYGLEDNFVNAFEPTLTTTFTSFGLQAFKVQYWTGSAWQTIPGGDVTGNDKVWRQFNFPAITTTALQIEVSIGANRFSRIVEVEAYARGNGSQETYTYDKVGNRKTQTVAGTTRYYNVNAGNRLTDIRTGSATGPVYESYQYDANGSLTQISGNRNLSLSWDANNRASAISGRTYRYDPSDYRIGKGGTGATLNYYLDGEHLDAVYDGGITVQSQHLRGSIIDEVVYSYQRDSSGKLVAATSHHDALQSVLGESNHQGAIQYRQAYTAFGTATNTSQPQRYTGREMDSESGLYYYRARYYDPVTGRFISEDPLGFGAGINFYSYCFNSPINCNDPSGLRADVFVTPLPNGQQGYAFRAVDDMDSPTVTGYFNVTTSNNSNPLLPGDFTLSPRPHIEVKTGIAGYIQMLGSFLSGNITGDVNRREGVPLISNTDQPGVISYANGIIRRGVEIHPGRDPITGEGGSSLGCLVCNNIDYGKLNQMLQKNYNNGGAFLHVLPEALSRSSISSNSISAFNSTLESINSQINSIAGLNPVLGNISVDFLGFGDDVAAANGGFVLYPNKPNNNIARAVYSK